MPRIYRWTFPVRSYEIDQFGHVNNAVYLNYLEETAVRASADAGYDNNWFDADGSLWVVRTMSLRYFEPAVYGDELEAASWVSDFRRVRSHREYEIKRARDGVRILRARADWVYLDRYTMKPKKLATEFEHAYDPVPNSQEELGIYLKNPQRFDDSHHFVARWHVQPHEIDRVEHVNNAVYLRWVENAFYRAMHSVGWGHERMKAENFLILAGAHEIEYFQSAQLGDEITVTSWAAEIERVRGAWIHEIRRSDTNELLARDYAVGIFLHRQNDALKPERLPEKLFHSMRAGEPT